MPMSLTSTSAVQRPSTSRAWAAEPAVRSGRARLTLLEPLEDEGQCLGPNALTVVGDRDLDVRVDPFEHHLHPATLGSELDGVREEVPHHLLQPFGVAQYRPDVAV